jgi:sugar lactone lactonase YvrE
MSRSLAALSVCLVTALALVAPRSSAAFAAPPPFVTMWGTAGSGNGQFNDPAGVAVDGSGFVYVADTGNNRVQKFTTAGAYVAQWGGLGSGNGQFSGPFGITVAGGVVYVVDTGNQRVQYFNTSGGYLGQWGGAGSGNGTFSQPLCVAVDPSGNVYVTDYNLNLVQKFTGTGTFITQWGGTGALPGQFSGAAGICSDAWGLIFVSDSGNNRVQFFDGAGTYQGYWGGPGTGNGQFSLPLGLATDGQDITVLDTGNHRVQVMTIVGWYKYQWNTGGGPFVHPHAAAIDGNAIYVADTEANRIQKFVYPDVEECHSCNPQADPCCEALPTVGGPWSNILVTTHQRSYAQTNSYAVTIYDLNAPPIPAEDNNWASMTRYHGPGNSWTSDSLGSVFGLTLDEYGNIFVTHTSCYYGDEIGQVFGAGPGAVYRIDGATGKITVFCKLPNFADGSLTPPEDYPGLGNITYDCNHKQFFVTDLEDGKIYRIKPVGVNGPTGTVVETFDPLTPDNGLAGFAPIGQRLWGVQWHRDRVYYSVWAVDASEGSGFNEIRSVALLPSGAFNPGSDQHELYVPHQQGNSYSNPVADVSFSANGRMLLGERGITSKTSPTAHAARDLEYVCSGGCWVPGNHYRTGDLLPRENAEGGVDYDRNPFGGPTSPIGRAWVSGDALHFNPPYTDVIYGFEGFRPNLLYGSILNSMLVDADGSVVDQDKTLMGDVEAPGCPQETMGSLCGHKFNDLNRNGVPNGSEPGLPGWTIVLNGPGGPYTAVTDVDGNFCFKGLSAGVYTLSEVGQAGWVETAPPGGTFTVPLAAGQTLTGYDFGNYTCGGVPGGCVAPPPMMIAWWPFNESTSSTTASDVTHLSPARNVAQLVGGAAITNGGEVQRALCVGSEGAYARVPIANQIGTNWGTSPFAIDGWVKPQASGATQRMIIEKRTLVSASPYRTLGWALYMNGQQLFLELGIGVSTQIVPGPTIPAGVWTHVAVSVDRAPAAGRWYVNGALVAPFNFVPTSGPVSNSGDIYMGQVSPPFGVASGFLGCIDELEVISTPAPATSVLPAASVAAIYNAGVAGKCPETLLMPAVTTICKNDTTVKVCFNICNSTGATQSYHWSASALAAGPGCTVAGPASFSPPAGTVTLAPGACSAAICVTMPRPAGLTTQNATSCFAISFVNDSTGACQTRTATIRADFTCHCITPAQTGIVSVPGRLAPGIAGVPVVIGIKFPCDPHTALDYAVHAQSLNPDHPDPLEVRLNGLPPGEPVIGTLQVQPGNPDQEVTVQVAYDGYDPATPYEIWLEADTDGDGVMERQAGTIVQSTYDENETAGARPDPGVTESVRLAIAPNPFLGGSSIAFTLAAPQDVDLGIFDLVGRRVRQIQRGRLAAGPHAFEWNGRDDGGRRVAAGIYFVRYQTPERRMEAKLVKLQ